MRRLLMRGGVFLFCVGEGATIGFPQQNEPGGALPIGKARFSAEIRDVESSLPEISDRGAATFFLARLYANLGDSQKALTLLNGSNEGRN